MLLLSLLLGLAASAPAGAAEARRVEVGVLKLSSSAPVFLGVEKGFFREAGVEPELEEALRAQPW